MSRAPRVAEPEADTEMDAEAFLGSVAERKAKMHSGAILTAERTMLGWVRTGIQLMALGFMLARFELLFTAGRFHLGPAAGSLLASPLVGAAVIGQGAVVCVVAAVRYLRAYQAIQRGVISAPDAVGPTLVAVGTMAMAFVLAALVWNVMSGASR